MILHSLRLQNFKGITDFILPTNGKNVDIFGNNGTGKTTLPDAFCWLLFGKDSNGKADFEIKPLTEDGDPIHNLETVVEAVLIANDKETKLKKQFSEVWKTKRGEAEAKFSGHTIDHFVDGVPVSEREYKIAIESLCPTEAIFKLLTNPGYFNEQMKWQDRRKVLFDIAGDMTDQDVIDADPELKPLNAMMEKHTLEEYARILAAEKKEVTKRKDELPIRISEQKNSIPHAPSRTAEVISKEIIKLTKEREAKKAELDRIGNGGEIAQKTKELREAEAELQEVKNRLNAGKAKEVERINGEIADLRKQIRVIQAAMPTALFDTTDLEKDIIALREQWRVENEKTYDGSDTCPTCKQPLPAWQIEEAVATFNRNKAENLKNITEHGQMFAAELKAVKEKNARTQKMADDMTERAAAIGVEIQGLESDLRQLEQTAIISSERDKAQKRIDGLRSSIGALELKGDELTEGLQAEVDVFNEQIRALDQEQASIEHHKQTTARIAELEKEQKEIAGRAGEIEQALFLLEQFSRRKASLVEERVNSRFKFAKFKLFNQLINGGIEETCETLYGGVPYSTGLNTGHKIIVGLDIINTLSEHYGFRPPIFIDNAECVTDLPEMQSQMIRLIKPQIKTAADRKRYSKLVIETEATNDGK